MERQEFTNIIKEHQHLIFKICYSYCNQYEDRKDLEQEILIQVWRSLKKFDHGVKLSTWIYRVALNTAISFHRKHSKNTTHTTLNESIISLSNEHDAFILDEKIEALYKFINRLGDFDKALILLYLDEKPQKEIASIMGISESNVATKISRIKLKLKNNFKSK